MQPNQIPYLLSNDVREHPSRSQAHDSTTLTETPKQFLHISLMKRRDQHVQITTSRTRQVLCHQIESPLMSEWLHLANDKPASTCHATGQRWRCKQPRDVPAPRREHRITCLLGEVLDREGSPALCLSETEEKYEYKKNASVMVGNVDQDEVQFQVSKAANLPLPRFNLLTTLRIYFSRRSSPIVHAPLFHITTSHHIITMNY